MARYARLDLLEKDLPSCFGEYEAGNQLCDGRLNPGERRESETRCAIRSACVKVQGACAKYRCTPQEWLAQVPKDLPNLLRGGRLHYEPIVFVPDEKFARPRKDSELFFEVNRRRALALADHFELLMRDSFPKRRFEVLKDRAEKPVLFNGGTFYTTSHLRPGKKSYESITWFSTELTRLDKQVAQLLPSARNGKISIRLPFPMELVKTKSTLKDFGKLNVVNDHEGTLRIRCKELGLESVGIVVQMIERFDREGLHPLPEVT